MISGGGGAMEHRMGSMSKARENVKPQGGLGFIFLRVRNPEIKIRVRELQINEKESHT